MNIALGSYFSQTGICKALDIYNFPEDYRNNLSMIPRAIRYLFVHYNKYTPLPLKSDIVKSCLSHIQKFKQINYIEGTREIIDILVEFFPQRRLEFLNILDMEETKNQIMFQPEIKEQKQQEIIRVNSPDKSKFKTVYGDKQNVHNTTINKSVIKALENIYNINENIIKLDDQNDSEKFNYKINMINNIRSGFISEYPEKTSLINETLDYIINSTCVFGKKRLDMTDAFLSIWLWISENNDKKQLKERLLEEFREMKGLCTTGHLARLVNSIQGFTTDEKISIRISNLDQINSVVRNYLTKELSLCKDEEIISQMTDGGDKFVKFIRLSVSKKILEWEKEYGNECIGEIAKIVNNFSNVNIFKV